MRDFSFDRSEKVAGSMPHSVELGLPGGCDEVTSYATVLNRGYLALEADIKKHNVCVKASAPPLKKDEGSEDSPDGVKDLNPCSKGKDSDQAVKEYNFTAEFYAIWKHLLEKSDEILKTCSSVYGVSAKVYWADLEWYETRLLTLRDQYKALGYEITQKDPLADKPKSVTEGITDTAIGILKGLALLVGGFLVIDYVYDRKPSSYVASKV